MSIALVEDTGIRTSTLPPLFEITFLLAVAGISVAVFAVSIATTFLIWLLPVSFIFARLFRPLS